jgi:ferritin-like metal-binding protein YciE
MKINDVETLLQEELKDIYDAEKRLVRAIPKMAKAASSEELQSALREHLDVTKNQVSRLEQVFELLGVPAKGKACAGMKGIIEEGEEVMDQDGDENLLDAAIAGAAQRVEHYEMAAYAAARTLAEQIGNSEVVDLLQQTWDEEREADEKLAEIATNVLSGMQSGGAEGEDMGEEDEQQPQRSSRQGKGRSKQPAMKRSAASRQSS